MEKENKNRKQGENQAPFLMAMWYYLWNAVVTGWQIIYHTAGSQIQYLIYFCVTQELIMKAWFLLPPILKYKTHKKYPDIYVTPKV